MTELDSVLVGELLRQSMCQGQYPLVTVVSDSMAPMIRRGERISIAPTSLEQLAPGDIVVVSSATKLVTHRFWGLVRQDGRCQLLTKGDRSRHFDLPSTSEDLIGRVTARWRDDRLLPLTFGLGLWLNRRLAKLALLEIRLFANSAGMDSKTNIHNVAWPISLVGRANIFVRLIRRLIYFWARCLTRVVDLAIPLLEKDSK